MNPANALTVLRLALAPVILHAVLNARHGPALAWFTVAAVTDSLDGLLARRCGWATVLGAYLDPIADKVLLSGVYLALALAGGLPWWVVGLVFTRDVLILSFAGLLLALGRTRRFEPSFWGKASTVCQVIAAVAWMARNTFPSPALDTAALALLWPAAALTLVSGAQYAFRGARLLAHH